MTEAILNEVLSRIPPSVKTKKEFYLLFEKGFFGNRMRTWDSYVDILEDKHSLPICIRTRNKTNWKTRYLVPIKDIPETLKELEKNSISEDQIIYNENPPDDKLIFQGEIMRTDKGLYLFYSTIKKPMKKALAEEQKTVTGLRALSFLKEKLNPASYHDLFELMELFPEDIIEFGVYSCNLGNLPGRNMIIWEVRNY